MRLASLLLLLSVLFAAPDGRAQGTGALAGRVLDAATGEGLPGANVIIEGTQLGAATDLDGNYRIIGIPVGAYTVTARFVGYSAFSIDAVLIQSGYTSQVDFELGSGIELNEVVVEYERPLIQRDAIGSARIVSGDEMRGQDSGGRSRRPRPQPVTPSGANVRPPQRGVSSVAALQGGVVHSRGGRDAQVQYYIDGVRITDPSWNAPPTDREGYAPIEEIGFRGVEDTPLSTFSIDVDRASYANVRRMLQDGYLPPPSAVRIEEFVNAFEYDYPDPDGVHPFAVHTEVAVCPWAPEHRLVRIALQGRRIDTADLPPNNLVFLIDVSGSMGSPDKLPLLLQSFRLLVDELRPQDRVSIVVYAGAAGLVLEPTAGNRKDRILASLNRLQSGGSTAGGAGLQLAYDVARRYLDPEGNNRVILATDGDFNVGPSSDAEMQRLIERERESGVFLSVLGFGTGNLQDAKMETIADHGNGNYSYIDSIREAQRVLVREMGGTLNAIAKDVKIQVEFNPAQVAAHRLIGYENRMLRDEEFNDDTRDAGELGAGHRVTALYEIVPVGVRSASVEAPEVDALKYQTGTQFTAAAESDELMTVKLRYKPFTGPGRFADESVLLDTAIRDQDGAVDQASEALQFASSVAEFGLLLRRSVYAPEASYEAVLARSRSARGDDPHGDRAEFIRLVESAAALHRAAADPAVSLRD